MKTSDVKQVSIKQLSDLKIDLLICSSGYESRSIFLSKDLELEHIALKIAFLFKYQDGGHVRKKNDAFFSEQGFKLVASDGDSSEDVLEELLNLKFPSDTKCNIVIDYSCMTRVWYSSILSFFHNISRTNPITLFFSYSHSKFVPSPDIDSYNIHIGPIRGFSNLTIPQKPTALIIGLGYDKNRALGLHEYFDGETYLFYTDGSKGESFSEEVERNNRFLLSQIKKQNTCRYPINDLEKLYSQLYDLCKDLSTTYRVIIAPCGPKPFALVSLVIAIQLMNIDVWRISPGKNAPELDKSAEGEVTLLSVTF